MNIEIVPSVNPSLVEHLILNRGSGMHSLIMAMNDLPNRWGIKREEIGEIVLLIDGMKIVGWAAAPPTLMSGGSRLMMVYVHPEYRRKSGGRMLGQTLQRLYPDAVCMRWSMEATFFYNDLGVRERA